MDPQPLHPVMALVLACLCIGAAVAWHRLGWLRMSDIPARRPPGQMDYPDLIVGVLLYLAGGVLGYEVTRRLLGVLPPFDLNTQGHLMGLFQVVAAAPALIFYVIRSRSDSKATTPDQPSDLSNPAPRLTDHALVIGAVGALTMLPVILLLNAGLVEFSVHVLGQDRPVQGHGLLQALIQHPTPINFFWVGLSAVVLAPIVEEVLFRGILQGTMRRAGRVPALLTSSLLFSLVHFKAVPWQVLPSLLVLGLALGLLYERTNRLLPCILLHALFNGMNLALVFLLLKFNG